MNRNTENLIVRATGATDPHLVAEIERVIRDEILLKPIDRIDPETVGTHAHAAVRIIDAPSACPLRVLRVSWPRRSLLRRKRRRPDPADRWQLRSQLGGRESSALRDARGGRRGGSPCEQSACRRADQRRRDALSRARAALVPCPAFPAARAGQSFQREQHPCRSSHNTNPPLPTSSGRVFTCGAAPVNLVRSEYQTRTLCQNTPKRTTSRRPSESLA